MNIFITGASSGLGAALARHYAATLGTNAVIGLAGRDAERLEAVARSLSPASGAIYPFDIRDRKALEAAAHDFVSRFGAPDLVIANAGISAGTRGDDGNDLAILDDVLAANVIGLAATLQVFIPSMRARGGVLAGIASVAGIRGIPGSGAYSASKAAAIAWLEALRVELRGSGLRVVTVCPGYVDTPMTRRNGFAMPFLLRADIAALRVARAIASGRALVVVPWQMLLVSWILRLLPAFVFDRAFQRAPRKPRGNSARP